MMEMYNRNCAFLKRFIPDLAAVVEQAGSIVESPYICEPAKNGEPTLALKNEKNEVFQVHSKYNPGDEGRRIIDGEDLENKTIVIVIGLGLGYHLNELVKRKKTYTTVLVIEKDPEPFKLFLESADIEKLHNDHVYFIVGKAPAEVAEAMKPFWWHISTNKHVLLPYFPLTNCRVDAIKEYYYELSADIKRQMNYYMLNQNTMISHSKEMQEHIWENMTGIATHHGVNSLFAKTRGVPAIIVAAGPSLDKQLPLLKKAKGKAVIICVDTALKTLLAHGIKPDIAIAVDYSQLNYEKVKGVDTDGYYMAVLPAVVPAFFEQFKKDMFIYYNEGVFYEWLGRTVGEKGMLPAGGSVTHSGFQLALKMGCDPVVFVGLDLAYTGGDTHSSGGMYDGETVDTLNRETLVHVKSQDGSPVYTSRGMWGMILAFEKMFNECGVKVIDATEGGALVNGADMMPFAEVCNEYLTEEHAVGDILRSCIDKDIDIDKERVVSAVAEVADDMKLIGDMAAEGEITAQRLLKLLRKKGYNPQKAARYFEAIKAAHEKIKSRQHVVELIDNYLMGLTREHMVNKEFVESEAQESRDAIIPEIKALKKFFLGVNEACSWYHERADGALGRLKQASF